MTTPTPLQDTSLDVDQPQIGGDPRALADSAKLAAAPNRAEQPSAQSPLVAAPVPEDMQDALRALLRGYELESDAMRRHKVRQWREAEEFWKGNQNIWFSTKDSAWHTPFERDDAGREDMPRFDYTVNLYRPWGLSIIAALSRAPVKVQYMPVSAESEDDIATAKSASRVGELVARNNALDVLRVKKAYYLWNEGIFATYVRYVVDGGLYGYHNEGDAEERTIQVLPDRWECADCNSYMAADSPDARASIAGGPVACRNCGMLMGPESFHAAEHLTATVESEPKRVPNGAEKMDVYGPLYFKVPPQATEQRDCYYFILCEEMHEAVLRAAYPQKADKISDNGSSGEDTYERIVRLSLSDAQGSWNTLPMSRLVTYKRAWLRPEAFWAHADEEMRSRLLSAFPEGCRVEFAGDTFLHAEREKMDDCWSLCPGQPGIGIYSDALGLDALSIQRQVNDSANILAEYREMASCPPILYDARYINGDALARKRMQPGSYVPVVIESAGPQHALASLIEQPVFHVDPELWNDGSRLAEAGQFITGALPSMFGGGMPNLKTAAAYAQSREQAMGRLQLVWRQMREAEAREMTLAVECFRRNRSEDVEMVVEGDSRAYRSEYIRLSEIRGNIIARPTADEDYPQSFGEVRESIQQMMQSKDPEILNVLGAAVNRPFLKQYMGVPDLVDPDEDNRSKQFREIDELMQSGPTEGANGQLIPSIMPDALVDDHEVHIAAIREWAVSQAGIQAKNVQPRGYANVLAHLMAHQDAEQAVAEQQQRRRLAVQTAGAPPPSAPPGGAGPGNPVTLGAHVPPTAGAVTPTAPQGGGQ